MPPLPVPSKASIPEPRTLLPPSPQPAIPSAGRGGSQHKYLQELIRRWAESRNYRVAVEKQILGGLGSVDVSLEKEGVSIACEISVTSGIGHEVGNIQKCVAAGYAHVVAVGTDLKALGKLKAAALRIEGTGASALHFFMPEELFAFLSAQDAPPHEEQKTVRGYKVKVQVTPPTDAEQKLKSRAIAQTVLSAMRRLNERKRQQP